MQTLTSFFSILLVSLSSVADDSCQVNWSQHSQEINRFFQGQIQTDSGFGTALNEFMSSGGKRDVYDENDQRIIDLYCDAQDGYLYYENRSDKSYCDLSVSGSEVSTYCGSLEDDDYQDDDSDDEAEDDGESDSDQGSDEDNFDVGEDDQ